MRRDLVLLREVVWGRRLSLCVEYVSGPALRGAQVLRDIWACNARALLDGKCRLGPRTPASVSNVPPRRTKE